MNSTITLFEPTQAHSAIQALWRTLKPFVMDGHRLRLSVKPESRSLSQNAKFHAMCEDFARSGLEWSGKARTAAQWKVLLVSGHAVATKEETEFCPGLEGEFVNLRESTARMSKARGSSLIEYSLAFGAQRGVNFSEPQP